ncbi:MAG: YncE family protein, partial [Blastocatellia bacterium]
MSEVWAGVHLSAGIAAAVLGLRVTVAAKRAKPSDNQRGEITMRRGTFRSKQSIIIHLGVTCTLFLMITGLTRSVCGQVKVQEDQDRPFYSAKKAANGTAAPAKEAVKPLSSISERVEKEGLAVEFSLDSIAAPGRKSAGLVSGAPALVSFRVTDSHTGQPVTGLHPTAWISQRLAAHPPNDAECKDKIREFVGGTFAAKPDIDLNTFYLLTLNSDKTIQVINPQVSSSITKLESYIELPGVGADWVLSANKEFLYVTIPDQSEVAVVSTINWKIVTTISTGKATKPTRAFLDPDGRYVWVGLDGSPEVAVIDVLGNALYRKVTVGAGVHNIAFTRDGRFAYVTNSDADTVSAIDTRTLRKVADIATGKTPAPIDYSTASHFIYAVALNGAEITVINPATQQAEARLPVKRGVVAFKFEPEGRYGFAADERDNQVIVIDSATNSIVSTMHVDKGPIQVNFTRGFAYIRCADSLRVALIELGQVRKGVFSVAYVQVGNKPVSDDPDDIGVSDGMQPTPEGNSAVISNAAEQTVYYYV